MVDLAKKANVAELNSRIAYNMDYITKKEFLTREEFAWLVDTYNGNGLTYYFDLFGWLENFKITPKGYTARDGMGNLVRFNARQNSKYRFYKDGVKIVLDEKEDLS